MKILLTIGDISITGGAERVCVNLANALSQAGHSVEILSFFRANKALPYAIDKQVALHIWHNEAESTYTQKQYSHFFSKLYHKNFYKFFLSLKIWRTFRGFDAIIANCATYTPFIKHKHTHYCKLIHLNFHSYHKRNNFFHTLIILSPAERHIWERYHKHIAIIPNFIHIPPQSADVCAPRILSVGRMDSGDQKGFLRLVDIWAKVQDVIRTSYPQLQSWQLVIRGDGSLRGALEQKIKDKGLQDSIILQSFTQDMQAEYLQASIYAMSSHYEGLPMVLAEASSYGLPCIAFDVPTGPSDIIKSNVSGYLIKDSDYNAYAQGLITLMNSLELRKTMGALAREYMQERFSKDVILPLWEEVLQKAKR
ncbi:glycosyltransferase family 4 protein [Helicobacter marmotae]|uniref:Glycosyltransferase family 4 protein n=1 Tax=Helicobacter marmotae TaxID=152490 RepID=A0A3D8I1I7_9HELI|nr:glycosyltransferase family 4 protein [Helicobacter marmotae]RDU58955.1 glycosyltransferase family 4 protein [Helicobacter marmotae]